MKYSTLQRMIADKERYKDFFSIIKLPDGMNRIYLNNYFVSSRGKKVPFVVLNPKTYNLLIQ